MRASVSRWLAGLGALLCTACTATGTASPDQSPYPGWTRVHASTLRHRAADVAIVSAVFADGRRALMPERALDASDHLTLIDLDTAVRTRLDTPGLKVTWMYPAGDSVLIDPGSGMPGEPDPPHHRVHPDGRVSRLETLNVITGHIGEAGILKDGEASARHLLQNGELDALVRVDVQQHDARVRKDFQAPWRYFNDRWALCVNFVAERVNAMLEPQVKAHYVMDWQQWPVPVLEGYRFEIERAPYHDYAGGTSNQRVLRLQVWQGGRRLHDISPRDVTFHVLVRGRRLWLIGESADYVDLP